MSLAATVKWCARHKRELPVSLFGRNRSRADGLNTYCRKCASSILIESRRRHGVSPIPGRRYPSAEVRLLAHAEPEPMSGCWIWLAMSVRGGYGRISYLGKMWLAHRLAYELWSAPGGQTDVQHRSDKPASVNPRHLFLGSDATNIADRDAKGRTATGEQNGRSRLTLVMVREIRRSYAAGEETKAALARRFGVSADCVGDVVYGRTWPLPDRSDSGALERHA